MSAETEVVQKTHQFLKSHPLADQSVLRLYTDAHTTLLPHKTLSPFQRFTLDLGDFVMHPDLVGHLIDGKIMKNNLLGMTWRKLRWIFQMNSWRS